MAAGFNILSQPALLRMAADLADNIPYGAKPSAFTSLPNMLNCMYGGYDAATSAAAASFVTAAAAEAPTMNTVTDTSAQSQLIDRFVGVLEDFKRMNYNVNVEKQVLEQQGMTLQAQARLMRESIFKLQREIETYRAQNAQLVEQFDGERRSASSEQQRLRGEIERLSSTVEQHCAGIRSLESECQTRKNQVVELNKTLQDLEMKYKVLETEKANLEVGLSRERLRTERELEQQTREYRKEVELFTVNRDMLLRERDQKIQALGEECERIRRERQDAEKRLESYKRELEDLGARYESARIECVESRLRAEKVNAENLDLAEQKKSSQLYIMDLEQQFDDYKRSQQQRILSMENEFRLRAEQKMLEFNDMLQQRDALAVEVKDCCSKLKQLDKERTSLRDCQQHLTAELDKYAERERTLREAKTVDEEALEDMRTRLMERDEEMRLLRRQHKDQMEQLNHQKVTDYSTLRENFVKQEERLRESHTRCEELRSLVEEWRAKAQKIEAEHRYAADEFEQSRQQLAEHKSLLKAKQTETALCSEQLEKMKKNNQSYNSEIIALNDHCDMLREEKNELMREMEELHLKLAESNHINQALKAELNTHSAALLQVRSEYEKCLKEAQGRVNAGGGPYTADGGGDAGQQHRQADLNFDADKNSYSRTRRRRRQSDQAQEQATSPTRRTVTVAGITDPSSWSQDSKSVNRQSYRSSVNKAAATRPVRTDNVRSGATTQRQVSAELRRTATTSQPQNSAYFSQPCGNASTSRNSSKNTHDVAEVRRKRDTEVLIAAIHGGV